MHVLAGRRICLFMTLLERLRVNIPIIQAPMVGVSSHVSNHLRVHADIPKCPIAVGEGD